VDTEEGGRQGPGGASATLGRMWHLTYCNINCYDATYSGFLFTSSPTIFSSQLLLWHILCSVQNGHCLRNSYCLMKAW